jgi:hypothetical protein
LKPFATRTYAAFSWSSIGSLRTVCVRTYDSAAQNSPTPNRIETSFQNDIIAQTKYRMMLRFVSCTASHTLVLPVTT